MHNVYINVDFYFEILKRVYFSCIMMKMNKKQRNPNDTKRGEGEKGREA